VVQTSDGGYALAGDTRSLGVGETDFWLVKTDANGNHLWNQTYSGLGYDHAHSMIQTVDGGYALAGDTDPFGAGASDFWLVKTDANGIIPEFPTWTPFFFMVIIFTLTIAIYKRHARN